MKKTILLSAFALAGISTSQAALTALGDGGFDTNETPDTHAANLGSPWFESVGGPGNGDDIGTDYNDWVSAGVDSAVLGQLSGNTGNAAAFSNSNGYAYQYLGTADGNELSASLTGANVTRNGSTGGGLVFEFFTATVALGADGTAASALAGSVLIDTKTVALGAGTAAINETFDLSGLTAGDNVFFQVRRADAANEEVWVDTLALSYTAVPEPSSAALLGLGGLALILRRRK